MVLAENSMWILLRGGQPPQMWYCDVSQLLFFLAYSWTACTAPLTLEGPIKCPADKKMFCLLLLNYPCLAAVSLNSFASVHLFIYLLHLFRCICDSAHPILRVISPTNRSRLFHWGIYNEDEGGQDGRVVWGGAFIFSAPHVIFIVNKTDLAFLSMQGLAAEASLLRERRWRLREEGSSG